MRRLRRPWLRRDRLRLQRAAGGAEGGQGDLVRAGDRGLDGLGGGGVTALPSLLQLAG
jgi:hypothetical protein